jgi:hypothetical protein
MLTTCDPSTLFATKAQIERAVTILARKAIITGQKPLTAHPFKAADVGDVDLEDDAVMWRARKLKDAAVHPDTGRIIPPPFRMAGYGVPCIFPALTHRTDAALTTYVRMSRDGPNQFLV